MTQPLFEQTLSEDQLRTLLARAADIEAASARPITLQDALVIAREAGISEAAVLQAASEFEQSIAEPDVSSVRWGKWLSMLRHAGMGALFGSVAALFSTPRGPEMDYGAIIGIVALTATSIVHAVDAPRQSQFQGILASLWSGFILSWVLLGDGFDPVRGATTLAGFWLVAAAVGGVVNALRAERRAETTGSHPATTTMVSKAPEAIC